MEEPSEGASAPAGDGCGAITVRVSPTTGGEFAIAVDPAIAVESLKKLVSKRLKLPRDRICLLFRNKQLQEGRIDQYGVCHDSKITLVPNVETGLIAQRPEAGIIQALETLNDAQVHEFLCGKAPLNLSMRLGDHMMLIQLQLSTVPGVKPSLPGAGPANVTRGSPSLIQASRNLQHTLRRLSADVFSGRDEGRRGSIYSGTFSGALNPALQDPKGRPRRDVATIVHILNDLLCSAPELRRTTAASAAAPAATAARRPDGAAPRAPSAAAAAAARPSEAAGGAESPAPAPQQQPAAAAAADDQVLRTRGKLEHLRLVMGERRARRRQRKRKPYALPSAPGDADTVTA